MNFDPHHLVIAPVLIPLIAGALMLFFDDRERRLKTTIALLSGLALFAVAVMLLRRVHIGQDAVALVYGFFYLLLYMGGR